MLSVFHALTSLNWPHSPGGASTLSSGQPRLLGGGMQHTARRQGAGVAERSEPRCLFPAPVNPLRHVLIWVLTLWPILWDPSRSHLGSSSSPAGERPCACWRGGTGSWRVPPVAKSRTDVCMATQRASHRFPQPPRLVCNKGRPQGLLV